MQDRPTAVELLQAAQRFCEDDLIPNLQGRVRFHARVLRNVLAILEREWELEEDAVRAEWDRLRALLGADAKRPGTLREAAAQVSEWNRELSRSIRAGEMDDRFDEALDAVYRSVLDKLRVANPRYSAPSSEA